MVKPLRTLANVLHCAARTRLTAGIAVALIGAVACWIAPRAGQAAPPSEKEMVAASATKEAAPGGSKSRPAKQESEDESDDVVLVGDGALIGDGVLADDAVLTSDGVLAGDAPSDEGSTPAGEDAEKKSAADKAKLRREEYQEHLHRHAENCACENCDCATHRMTDCDCPECQCCMPAVSPYRLWWSLEILGWETKTAAVPPLVTGGGNGVIGRPGTHVLLDDLDFSDQTRGGPRFTYGYHLGPDPYSSLELSWFLLDRQWRGLTYDSDGWVLGRPYINASSGLPAVTLVAAPGTATGDLTVWTQQALTGVEFNKVRAKRWSDTYHISLLSGFRYLRLVDKVNIDEEFQVAANVPGFGGSHVNLEDNFRTANDFFGGQLGLDVGRKLGRWTFDARGKFAIGLMSETANINGSTNVYSAMGQTSVYEGGLLALKTNIGRYHQNAFAFIPELNLNLGFQLTKRIRLFAGYSILWVSSVARAGEQIDPTVNTSVFPILSGNGTLVGPARPRFDFAESDFWAQGVNFGGELRY